MSKNYAILLAGGQGSRFWPLSRTLEPKQFLLLHKEKSLFEQTLARIKSYIPPANIFIVTSELYRHQLQELIRPFSIPNSNVIFESEGKNTAPSIGVAVQFIHRKDPLARACVLPCDHLIKNEAAFIRILKKAFEPAQNCLIVFGITPTRPATGYGYIQAGKAAAKRQAAVVEVKRFCEKPDAETARRFLKQGCFFWNSGIFAGPTKVFLDEFRAHLPQLFNLLGALKASNDLNCIWDKVTAVSFDYGVLEKSRNLRMIIADNLGWSDLGSWQAWDEVVRKDKDKDNNFFKADVINLGSKNVTVLGNNRLIAALGLEDLIIVDTPDALLITKKDLSEDVRKVVDSLRARRRQEHYAHKTVRRPWKHYTVLEIGNGFKVKLVEVKPRHALSLQLHNKRSEHWVVVEGRAKIIKGRKAYWLNANESIYVPAGCLHRIVNPADSALKIVEVQAGGYLQEDDIIRLKDDFGRVENEGKKRRNPRQ